MWWVGDLLQVSTPTVIQRNVISSILFLGRKWNQIWMMLALRARCNLGYLYVSTVFKSGIFLSKFGSERQVHQLYQGSIYRLVDTSITISIVLNYHYCFYVYFICIFNSLNQLMFIIQLPPTRYKLNNLRHSNSKYSNLRN